MPTACFSPGAAVLPSGRVMIVGGQHADKSYSTSAAIFDPKTESWTAAPPLPVAHGGLAVRMQDWVLVAGNDDPRSPAPTSFAFNENEGRWLEIAPPPGKRHNATATVLKSGEVLLAGGSNEASNLMPRTAELYLPAQNFWAQVAQTMARPRVMHTATLLDSGRVLVTGGMQAGSGTAQWETEIFHPETIGWEPATQMTQPRFAHTATLLRSGKVLVVGGFSAPNAALASAELYDPATNRWSPLPAPQTPRAHHTATLLKSGQVLIAGGEHNGIPVRSVEVFNPIEGVWEEIEPLSLARSRHAAILAGDQVLVAGGLTASGAEAASVELLSLTPVKKGPRISPVPDVVAITQKPGDAGIKGVPYPTLVVESYDPAEPVECTPPATSTFALGTTTVRCRVTDANRLSASVNFKVTVWDVCLRDDDTSDMLYINSRTGNFYFRRCGGDDLSFGGNGEIKAGCKTELKHNKDKVTASFDQCDGEQRNTGSATIKLGDGVEIKINDKNILDNHNLNCPGK